MCKTVGVKRRGNRSTLLNSKVTPSFMIAPMGITENISLRDNSSSSTKTNRFVKNNAGKWVRSSIEDNAGASSGSGVQEAPSAAKEMWAPMENEYD